MPDAHRIAGQNDFALATESETRNAGTTRRSFLTGLAVTGAIAAFPNAIPAWPQAGSSASAKAERIDVHHHFTTSKLFELSTAKGVNQPTKGLDSGKID